MVDVRSPANDANSHPRSLTNSDDLAVQAVALAERLLSEALQQQTHAERREASRLAKMVQDPRGKAFTFAMVDQVFRSHRPVVTANRYRRLLNDFGTPGYLGWQDRLLMRTGAIASRLLPAFIMNLIESRLRSDSAKVILSAEPKPLHRYLSQRRHDRFRVNLNHLGEAVLGEEEARRRQDTVLEYLRDPAVHYISVKVSALFSQIQLVAWDETLAEVKNRLRIVYRAAAGSGEFVNLDMEEYRDLWLTVTAFQSLLDEAEFRSFSAGIALQAYLPDSFAAQQQITQWARRRIEQGGAPVKIRLVKGANLAMEQVEAELHGWNQAPYATKSDTDANFRRMMEYGCQPDHARAVRLGVASHNLFDVALALTLRAHHGVEREIEIEMLEGMANHQARAVRDTADGLLLYSPAVHRDDFLSAMAYLVRRLDENTSAENFLRDLFSIRLGSAAWHTQLERFMNGWRERRTVSALSRRLLPAIPVSASDEFHNVADTDWTQASSRLALRAASAAWQPEPMPVLPGQEDMLRAALQAQVAWESIGVQQRAVVIQRAADVMATARFRTIACMRHEAKKNAMEADVEVSEAIDFARYYATQANVPSDVRAKSLGIVTVVSPWNFPYAIPAGGVFAALMAGNAVVLKPAPATRQTAWQLVNQLWHAGVPRDVLQFYPCDNDLGKPLITDPRVAAVVLTGSYETATLFQSWRPTLRLFAETSGKNAIIITAQADRELAIKDLVRSAFGHAGQKCSAASLAIVEAEVYDDPTFQRQLVDAAASLPVGMADQATSIVTPVISQPTAKLSRALQSLDDGEQWLLQPKPWSDDGCLWSPGIKMGVQPNSWFHHTECFGPVLGLMQANSLEHATALQNGTSFGLTAGLHSLDPQEIQWWKARAQAGNLYVNRPITGAIVRRQPFGGWKKSSIGPGAKAGGPHYVHSLYRLEDAQSQHDAAIDQDYQNAWTKYYSQTHDPSGLRCESNQLRYRPCRGVILRLRESDRISITRAQLAARITGVPLVISTADDESDQAFMQRLPLLVKQAEFLRTIEVPDEAVLRAALSLNLNWIDAPLLANGRLELSRWLREQSVTQTLHRYGQITELA